MAMMDPRELVNPFFLEDHVQEPLRQQDEDSSEANEAEEEQEGPLEQEPDEDSHQADESEGELVYRWILD